ncbi:hypothetical protein HY251_12660 [bacterium]|nr:hypothetical protein [bacterium]
MAPSGARIRGPFARLSVRADDLPRLTVALETRATERDKERGLIREIEVGEGGFDDRFLLVAKRPAPASKALARRAARKAISDAFNRLEMRRLEIHRSEVATTLPAEELRPERCLEMLEVLSTVARELEQVELDVRVLRGERRAIRGDLGRARCAYCHADVTGEEPDLVACESCSTVAHEDCWIELGHCPVLGCKGERPERARAS